MYIYYYRICYSEQFKLSYFVLKCIASDLVAYELLAHI